MEEVPPSPATSGRRRRDRRPGRNRPGLRALAKGAAVRLEQGGAAAGNGRTEGAGDGRTEGAGRGSSRSGAARKSRSVLVIPFGSRGNKRIGRNNFVFSRTFLLKTIIIRGVVSRTQLPKSFSVFGQRQVFFMRCSKGYLF